MTAFNPHPGSGAPDPRAEFHAAASSVAGLSWVALSERHRMERDAWLQGAITRLDTHYDKIGALGAAFRDEMKLVGCGEFVDTELPSRAAFHAHHLTLGFSNKIYYSAAALEMTASLFASRTHEGVHAFQFGRCAATHATPYNSGTKIILCPRDGVLLEELKERDAFAKQWLLQRLYEEDGYNAQSPEQLTQDLRRHADGILESLDWRQGYSFLDYYRDREIETYEGCMIRRYMREPNLVFVRLAPEDIWVLGGALGVNSFGDTPADVASRPNTHPLTAAQEGRITTLNRQLGIQDETVLPTLRQALLAGGSSPSQFLHRSMRPRTPQTSANGAASTPNPG